jgi:hypothetical protein
MNHCSRLPTVRFALLRQRLNSLVVLLARGLSEVAKISFMLGKARRRKSLLIVCMVLIALLPVAATKIFVATDRMTMYYDNHQQMEQEILRKIPVGSNPQVARQVMSQNGFTLTKQTGILLELEKEESYWPFYYGTFWTAEISVNNGEVSGAKVWIQPAD